MEDLLYEIHGKGLLDEVYAYAKVLREKEKYVLIDKIPTRYALITSQSRMLNKPIT